MPKQQEQEPTLAKLKKIEATAKLAHDRAKASTRKALRRHLEATDESALERTAKTLNHREGKEEASFDALEKAREKVTEKEYQESVKAQKTGVRDNAVLFMPIEALPQYMPNLTKSQREDLKETINTLSKTHPFIGGLLFENATDLNKEQGVHYKSLKLINKFMQQHDMKMGTLKTYGHQSDLRKIMTTSLSKHGISRRDKYRDLLNKILDNSKEHSEKLESSGNISFDQHNNLTMHFNLNADLKDKIATAALSNQEVTQAINGSLKRVIRQAFLQKIRSSIPTDEARIILDSKKTASISLSNDGMEVKIPLSKIVKGAFVADDVDGKPLLTSKHVKRAISDEIVHGIELSYAMKMTPA